MHVDIECVRLHARSWFVERDFGQSSIQAGPSVGCVPYFQACAEWKSETARTWGSTGTGLSCLHARQFACCLAFCPRTQRWGWRVLIERDYRNDRGWRSNASALLHNLPKSLRTLTFAPFFNQGLHHVRLPLGLQSLTFGTHFEGDFNQRISGQRDMASRPSKLDFGCIISIRAWTTWHGQQAFKVWLLVRISIRAWTTWHGQQAFKVWLLVRISIRAWTMWHGQQAFNLDNVDFKIWLLVGTSIRAWTMWHGQQAFKVWLLVMEFQSEPGQRDMASRPSKHLVRISQRLGNVIFAWLLEGFQSEPWQCDMASRPSKFDFFRAWTAWHGHQAFKVWLLVYASIRTWTLWHGQQVCDVWLLEKISIRAWTTWHGQQACKAWLLEKGSIRAWTMWHGQQVFKVWLWPAGLQRRYFNQSLDSVTWPAGLQSLTLGYSDFNQNLGQCDMASRPSKFDFWLSTSIRAWTIWHGQQAFKLWLLENISIRAWTDISIRAWTTWHGQQAFKVWLFGQNFDQSLDNVTWPAGLESLAFEAFAAEKLNVVWPEGLQSLSFLRIELPEEDSDDSDSSVDPEGLLSAWLPRMAGWPRALRKVFFCDLALVCWKRHAPHGCPWYLVTRK